MDGFLETLRRSGGINAVANQLDLPPAIAASGIEALLPAVLDGFSRGIGGQREQGGLMALLDDLGGGYLAADLISHGEADIERGKRIVAEIFGSAAVSQAVADDAAQRCAVEPAQLQRMLPPLAMLVGGYLAAQVSSGKLSGQFELASSGDSLARAEAAARGRA